MLIVTIELAPGGDMSKRETLGTAFIVNDGSGTAATGNYKIRLRGKRKLWRTGIVLGFPRQRLGPWDLLYRALRSTVGSRNKE